MHGAWSALDILIKKQNNAKYRKAKSRYDQQKKREKFLKDYDHDDRTELEFPQVSESQLEIIKKDIRKNARRKMMINLAINIIASIIMIYFMLYLAVMLPR